MNCTILRSQNGLGGDQNRPNPFANLTYISYETPQEATGIKVIVVDRTGKLLKTITGLTPGKGEAQLNKGNLSSGLYLYKLVADKGTSETKELIIE